jgi:hypothetical protein
VCPALCRDRGPDHRGDRDRPESQGDDRQRLLVRQPAADDADERQQREDHVAREEHDAEHPQRRVARPAGV